MNRIYIFFFSVRDQNLFHLVNTIGNIFTIDSATREKITDGVHSMKQIWTFLRKKQMIILYISFKTIFKGYPAFPFRPSILWLPIHGGQLRQETVQFTSNKVSISA